MPSFNKTIVQDSLQRSTVAFNYASSVTLNVSGLTGEIKPSELYGFKGLTSVTGTNMGISRIYWSMPVSTTACSIELAFGLSGSLTGQPLLNLNGSGMFDLYAAGNAIHTSYTGADRNNVITLRNTGSVPPNSGISVILEIDKLLGFK